MDIERHDTGDAAAREVSDRKAGDRPFQVGDEPARRGNAEEPSQLPARIRDARFETDLIEFVKRLEIRRENPSQGRRRVFLHRP